MSFNRLGRSQLIHKLKSTSVRQMQRTVIIEGMVQVLFLRTSTLRLIPSFLNLISLFSFQLL